MGTLLEGHRGFPNHDSLVRVSHLLIRNIPYCEALDYKVPSKPPNAYTISPFSPLHTSLPLSSLILQHRPRLIINRRINQPITQQLITSLEHIIHRNTQLRRDILHVQALVVLRRRLQ